MYYVGNTKTRRNKMRKRIKSFFTPVYKANGEVKNSWLDTRICLPCISTLLLITGLISLVMNIEFLGICLVLPGIAGFIILAILIAFHSD